VSLEFGNVLLVLLLFAVVFTVFFYFINFIKFVMSSHMPGKALKTLHPSDATKVAETRTLNYLFKTWTAPFWALTGSKLPIITWEKFAPLSEAAKVAPSRLI